jgi:hypothetical protein
VTLAPRDLVLAVFGVGIVTRLVLAFAFFGDVDVGSQLLVDEALDRDLLDVYATVNAAGYLWPYPPVYFLWLELASGISAVTGLAFHGVVQLLPIAADAGIAAMIYIYLGWRGAGERGRLAGAALVMLGPCFIAISGYHGQIDSVAILPAVLALMVWERRAHSIRGVESGVLIGLGAAIKWSPLLVALALAPSARSTREAVRLFLAAVAVPVAFLLPFFISEPDAVAELRSYSGFAGLGGLNLVLDPGLASEWMTGNVESQQLDGISLFLTDNAGLLVGIALIALAAFMLRHRPAPIEAAVLVWLTVYTFLPNFFLHYLVWGLPFFIMAGYLKETAILQLVLIPAILIVYLIPWPSDQIAIIYVPIMIGVWAFFAAALVTLLSRTVKGFKAATYP